MIYEKPKSVALAHSTTASLASTPPTRRQIGDRFELKAQAYLESLGYQIIDRNRVYPWGELDIVAEIDGKGLGSKSNRTLVFIEVRGTEAGAWITPEESLTRKKQMRLKRAIGTYLLYYKGFATEVRLDLIAVNGERISHYPQYIPW